jgi:hypothetical protein
MMADVVEEFEDNMYKVVCDKWGLTFPMPECVHVADARILATECDQLLAHKISKSEWLDNQEPLDMIIEPWEPFTAKTMFLQEHKKLMGEKLYRPMADAIDAEILKEAKDFVHERS